MYKTMCTYSELPPSFPTLPVQQTHEVIVVKKIIESAALEELEKGRELTVLFCTFDKMSFNLRLARKTQIWLSKWRCARKSFAMQKSHVQIRRQPWEESVWSENNPDDRYCTRYLSRGKQSKQNPKKMWQIEKWNISKMFTYVGNAYLKNTLLSSVTFVSFVLF